MRIREAMLRLSRVTRTDFYYDPAGTVFGDGPIHYLIEVDGLNFMAWEHNQGGNMIVTPISYYELDELQELGTDEPWTVLSVPRDLTEGVQFREIDSVELSAAYYRTAGWGRSSNCIALPCISLEDVNLECILEG
ncbi:hypothetical protein [Massilia sp. TS11]|uniref:hypothetical protein n=1 Tax=Massilia sp. TS11 TaxID=2908003 RepID=UPI001EDC23FC|nr:hypothetical protein [Massilia sp. TS11]MCG2585826.1 hypothetical protein [Massilia sp. TS11]